MKQHIKTKQYLETICSQIRYKKVHEEIREEIENHINDQKDAFKAQGMEDETAELKAIEQMGDPVIVGTELDRTYRPKPEWSIIALTFLLLFAGNFIRLFTSPQSINGLEVFYRQLIFTVIGMVMMALCYFMDFTFIGRYPKTIFLSLAALDILMIILSTPVRGRYVYASYVLLLFPTAFAGIVYSMRNKGYQGIIFCGFLFAVPFGISMIIPSLATSLLLSLSCLFILTISIFKGWFNSKKLYSLLLVYIPAMTVLLIVLSRRFLLERIKTALFPWTDPMGGGYIGTIIRQLLSGAQFLGQGMVPEGFADTPASRILPDIIGDFLLTYIIHKFGWFAFFVIIALLGIFIIRAFILCARQKSVLASLVSTAIISTIGIQALFYITVDLGFAFLSPMSLPLISQSISYLLTNMCLVGILLSVFRTGYFIKDKRADKKVRNNSFIRFEDGKLIIDFNIY